MKRLLASLLSSFLLLVFLAVPLSSAWAAVTRDAVSSGQKAAGAGTTLTISHTVTAAGSNRALYVLCGLDSGTITLTATYAAAAMTEVRRDQDAGFSLSSWIFKKINPATGANNIVVTLSGDDNIICYGFSATNVHQTTDITDHDGLCPGSVTSATLTLTTGAGELLIDLLTTSSDNATLAPGVNQTEEMDLAEGTTMSAAGSRQAGTDGGVMSWSWTGAEGACQSAISIKEAAAAAPRRPIPPIFFP